MSLRLWSPLLGLERVLGWAVGRKGEMGGVAGPLAQGTSSLDEQLMGHRLLELRPDGRR